MSDPNVSLAPEVPDFSNGRGAAAVLSAGIGAFFVAFLAILADKSAEIKDVMIFYKPTGPLSGVTTCAIIGWLIAWFVLHARWKNRNLAMGHVSAIALTLLMIGLLLTFPPIADLF
jgi:hypothetical protein